MSVHRHRTISPINKIIDSIGQSHRPQRCVVTPWVRPYLCFSQRQILFQKMVDGVSVPFQVIRGKQIHPGLQRLLCVGAASGRMCLQSPIRQSQSWLRLCDSLLCFVLPFGNIRGIPIDVRRTSREVGVEETWPAQQGVHYEQTA